MEVRMMEVKVICAKDLKNVNMFTKMDVYVKCSISSDPRSVQKSPVHKKGGSVPVWNQRFKFYVNESDIKSNRVGLVFSIVSKRILGDREIGRVYVPMKELYDDNVITGKNKSGEISVQERFMTYRVQTPSGKFKGSLDFSYSFGEKIVNRAVEEPVMAYPVFNGSGPGQGSYPVQGPPPNGYGYGHGYGYSSHPPMNQQASYGYGYPGQMRPKRGNGLGMGTAMGVGAGLLGGLMLGEMVDDIGYGGGYDGGYDGGMDGGMFDW